MGLLGNVSELFTLLCALERPWEYPIHVSNKECIGGRWKRLGRSIDMFEKFAEKAPLRSVHSCGSGMTINNKLARVLKCGAMCV